uniref:Uncharacterized protein n=1 Tax=Mesocestoides corti TaxID=53468 RepID=A0A5K3FGG0_MESCO
KIHVRIFEPEPLKSTRNCCLFTPAAPPPTQGSPFRSISPAALILTSLLIRTHELQAPCEPITSGLAGGLALLQDALVLCAPVNA